MAREVEADRAELLVELHLGRPGPRRRQGGAQGRFGVRKQPALPALPVSGGTGGKLRQDAGGFEDFRAVGLQPVERAGACELLESLLVDLPGVDPLGKIIKIPERTRLGADGGHMAHRFNADAFQGAECVDDGAAADVKVGA